VCLVPKFTTSGEVLITSFLIADFLRDKITAQPEKISEGIHLLSRSESSRALKEFGVLSGTIPSGFL
jgi:hypothetical protein